MKNTRVYVITRAVILEHYAQHVMLVCVCACIATCVLPWQQRQASLIVLVEKKSIYTYI